MATSQLIGLVLILTGIVDLVLALTVVGRRVPDENRRRIVVGTLVASCVGMLALGTAFLAGVIG